MNSRVFRRLRKWLLYACVVAVTTVLLGEVVIRTVGSRDANGTLIVLGIPVKPYALPYASIEAALAKYRERPDSYLRYDEQLGWAIRPDSVSEDGLYESNAGGLRAEQEYDTQRGDVLRVALFGDSFTHGDEIPLQETWGYQLQRVLAEKTPAEVLNFGVPGYGVDQSFERWRATGRMYQPDYVVLGLCLENVARCVNVMRPLYLQNTGIPFSKPRFVLDGKTLRRVNSPTLPPSKLSAEIRQFGSSPLAKYEFHFSARDYQPPWWSFSQTLCVAWTLKTANPATAAARTERLYDPRGEPCQVLLAILQEFKKEVNAAGAKFLIVYLPWMSDLASFVHGNAETQLGILREVEGITDVVRTEQSLITSGHPAELFVNIHYSGKANRIVSQLVGERMQADFPLSRQAEPASRP